MKKVITMFVAIVCAMTFAVEASAQRYTPSKVAISVSGDAGEYADIIGSEFSNRLMDVPCFTILAREDGCQFAIIDEQTYQLSGNVDEKEIRSIGKQYGAEYVMDVNVRYIGESMNIKARLVDMATGKIVYSTKLQNKIRSEEDVAGMAARCAYKVYQDFLNRKRVE